MIGRAQVNRIYMGNKRKVAAISLLCALWLLWLAGCGGKKGAEEPGDAVQAAPAEWKTKGFAVSEEVTEEQALWVVNYIPWEHQDESPDTTVTEIGVLDGKIYRFSLLSERSEGGKISAPARGILEICDTVSLETVRQEITREQMGITDRENVKVAGVTLVDGGTLALQVQSYRSDESENQFVLERNNRVYVPFDATGDTAGNAAAGDVTATGDSAAGDMTVVSEMAVDLLPLYLEKEILEPVSVQPRWAWSVESICDGAGNSYVRSGDDRHPFSDLYAFDREGGLLFSYEGDAGEQICLPMKTAEGDLIFPVLTDGGSATQLVWFDPQNGQKKLLAVIKKEAVRQLYGMQGNELYYENSKGIVKWNVASGERKLVLQFGENGGLGIFHTMLALREGQTPLLRAYGDINGAKEDWLVELSKEQPAPKDAVRVVSLEPDYNQYGSKVMTSNGAGRPIECMAMTARRNPAYEYSYENGKGMDQEDFRNRIMAEIAAGNGPDILYVTLEDMELMQEKGYLMDLGELLTGEDLQDVLPAVTELGKIDGRLVGLPAGVSAETTYTTAEVWDKDGISEEEILELLESGRFSYGCLINRTGTLANTGLMSWLTKIYRNEENFLIDWKRGESHFEDERFVRILEAAKKYGGPADGLFDVENGFLGEGGCPFTSVGDFESYRWFCEEYGDRLRDLGAPDGKGRGKLRCTGGAIVVNSRTAHPDAAKAYLKCMLSREVQGMDNYGDEESILKMDFADVTYVHFVYDDDHQLIDMQNIARDEIGDYDPADCKVFWKGYEGYAVREDGSSIVDDWKFFLERCSAAPREHETIEAILWEESAAFFSGDKSAREVAKVIDNRVQLYLDERAGE